MSAAAEGRTLVVRMVQPLVPKYREALFAALARTPGIAFEVWADLQPRQGSLKGAAAHSDFVCVHRPYSENGPFIWQPGEFEAVSPPANVVIMPWNSRYVQLIPALLRGRTNGVRTILFGHGLGKRESWLRRRFRNALIALADACILYSPGQAEALLAEGQPRSKIFVAPNSVDPAPIAAATAAWPAGRVDEFLALHGCTRGKTLLYISRLERWKRVDMLLLAVARLAASEPALRAAVIGDGEDRPRLETLARELGIADRILFVGPLYDEMAIAPWMLGSACLAFPAAIGLSMLHALHYGLPVISSDDRLPHGPEIEALRDGENGLLYRDGDVGSFADAIARIVGDAALQARMSAAAKATVTGPDGWNLDAMVRGFLAAIRGA